MLPSVRTVRPEKPSEPSYWTKVGEKRSPEIWTRSKPPVAETESWCWAALNADQVALRLPIWRNVSSLRRRYWNVSNGFDSVFPPPLNGFRTYVPVASRESRLITPGV